MEKKWKLGQIFFSWALKCLQIVTTAIKTLASWKKSYDKLIIFKSTDITLPTKVRTVKAMVFPVAMYGCESWTTEKAEHWRTDAFKRWCWRRLPRVPWTARRSNQSILKEINHDYSLEGLLLNLMFLYFGHPMGRADLLETILMLWKIEGKQENGMFR